MPYRVDARMTGRHPFELFLLALAFASGLPALIGATPEPGSIEAALPSWGAFLWSLTLVVGSGSALVGIYLRDRATGLIVEQLGLAFVGVAAVVYSGIILYVIGVGALFSAGITFAFGVSCLVRWRDIQNIIDAVHEEEKRRGTV